jgi:hypothetical protein
MWFAVRGTKSKVGKTHGLHSSPDAARFVGTVVQALGSSSLWMTLAVLWE